MISVTIWRDQHITSFEVKGHALFKPHGQDIVCAGVSTAAVMTFNLLEKKSSLSHQLNDGLLDVIIKQPSRETDDIMDVFLTAINDIIADYPKHITLNEREEARNA
jgi:uncharacterized protein YsxB (DUF464 family)